MNILINGTFFEVDKPVMTGKEIKFIGAIPSIDKLYRLEPTNGYEVKDDDEVMLIERDVFVSAAAPGYSS
jgi:hypothetical protein